MGFDISDVSPERVYDPEAAVSVQEMRTSEISAILDGDVDDALLAEFVSTEFDSAVPKVLAKYANTGKSVEQAIVDSTQKKKTKGSGFRKVATEDGEPVLRIVRSDEAYQIMQRMVGSTSMPGYAEKLAYYRTNKKGIKIVPKFVEEMRKLAIDYHDTYGTMTDAQGVALPRRRVVNVLKKRTIGLPPLTETLDHAVRDWTPFTPSESYSLTWYENNHPELLQLVLEGMMRYGGYSVTGLKRHFESKGNAKLTIKKFFHVDDADWRAVLRRFLRDSSVTVLPGVCHRAPGPVFTVLAWFMMFYHISGGALNDFIKMTAAIVCEWEREAERILLEVDPTEKKERRKLFDKKFGVLMHKNQAYVADLERDVKEALENKDTKRAAELSQEKDAFVNKFVAAKASQLSQKQHRHTVQVRGRKARKMQRQAARDAKFYTSTQDYVCESETAIEAEVRVVTNEAIFRKMRAERRIRLMEMLRADQVRQVRKFLGGSLVRSVTFEQGRPIMHHVVLSENFSDEDASLRQLADSIVSRQRELQNLRNRMRYVNTRALEAFCEAYRDTVKRITTRYAEIVLLKGNPRKGPTSEVERFCDRHLLEVRKIVAEAEEVRNWATMAADVPSRGRRLRPAEAFGDFARLTASPILAAVLIKHRTLLSLKSLIRIWKDWTIVAMTAPSVDAQVEARVEADRRYNWISDAMMAESMHSNFWVVHKDLAREIIDLVHDWGTERQFRILMEGVYGEYAALHCALFYGETPNYWCIRQVGQEGKPASKGASSVPLQGQSFFDDWGDDIFSEMYDRIMSYVVDFFDNDRDGLLRRTRAINVLLVMYGLWFKDLKVLVSAGLHTLALYSVDIVGICKKLWKVAKGFTIQGGRTEEVRVHGVLCNMGDYHTTSRRMAAQMSGSLNSPLGQVRTTWQDVLRGQRIKLSRAASHIIENDLRSASIINPVCWNDQQKLEFLTYTRATLGMVKGFTGQGLTDSVDVGGFVDFVAKATSVEKMTRDQTMKLKNFSTLISTFNGMDRASRNLLNLGTATVSHVARVLTGVDPFNPEATNLKGLVDTLSQRAYSFRLDKVEDCRDYRQLVADIWDLICIIEDTALRRDLLAAHKKLLEFKTAVEGKEAETAAIMKPVILYFGGPSGHGKSWSINMMAQRIMQALDVSNEIFKMPSDYKYFDIYANQKIAIGDEFLSPQASELRQKQYELLLNAGSGVPFPLPCAAVAMKNKTFWNSWFLLLTSNDMAMDDCGTHLAAPEAIGNRIDFFVLPAKRAQGDGGQFESNTFYVASNLPHHQEMLRKYEPCPSLEFTYTSVCSDKDILYYKVNGFELMKLTIQAHFWRSAQHAEQIKSGEETAGANYADLYVSERAAHLAKHPDLPAPSAANPKSSFENHMRLVSEAFREYVGKLSDRIAEHYEHGFHVWSFREYIGGGAERFDELYPQISQEQVKAADAMKALLAEPPCPSKLDHPTPVQWKVAVETWSDHLRTLWAHAVLVGGPLVIDFGWPTITTPHMLSRGQNLEVAARKFVKKGKGKLTGQGDTAKVPDDVFVAELYARYDVRPVSFFDLACRAAKHLALIGAVVAGVIAIRQLWKATNASDDDIANGEDTAYYRFQRAWTKAKSMARNMGDYVFPTEVEPAEAELFPVEAIEHLQFDEDCPLVDEDAKEGQSRTSKPMKRTWRSHQKKKWWEDFEQPEGQSLQVKPDKKKNPDIVGQGALVKSNVLARGAAFAKGSALSVTATMPDGTISYSQAFAIGARHVLCVAHTVDGCQEVSFVRYHVGAMAKSVTDKDPQFVPVPGFERNDWVLYVVPKNSSLQVFPNRTSRFSTLGFPEIENEDGAMCTCKPETTFGVVTKVTYNTLAKPETYTVGSASIANTAAQIVYSIDSDAGTCGSFLLDSHGAVCGVHVAGGSGQGLGIFINKEMIEKVLARLEGPHTPHFVPTDPSLPAGVKEGQGSCDQGYHLGRLERGPFINNASKLVPTAYCADITAFVETLTKKPADAPANLRHYLTNDGNVIDPLFNGLDAVNHRDHSAREIPYLTQIEDLIVSMFGTDTPDEVLSLEEAILGNDHMKPLNLTTSMGYLWENGPSQKKHYIKVEDGEVVSVDEGLRTRFHERLENARQGKRTLHLWSCTKKDEMKSYRDVDQEMVSAAEFTPGVIEFDGVYKRLKAARVFYNPQADWTLACRACYHGLVGRMHARPTSSACAVGLNPHVDLEVIYQRIIGQDGNILLSDFRDYDKSIPYIVAEAAVRLCARLAGHANDPLYETVMWENVVSYMLVGQDLWRACGSHMSGDALCAEYNVIVQLIIYYSVIWTMQKEKYGEPRFESVVGSSSCYGDDGLHGGLPDDFDGKRFAELIKELYGMDVTSNTKDGPPRLAREDDPIEYLGRTRTVLESGEVTWSLSIARIFRILAYTRDLSTNTLQGSINSASLEMSAHGRQVYAGWERFLRTHPYTAYRQLEVPSYDVSAQRRHNDKSWL